ncbi:hypothetical protein BH09PLA1_BH09PLA1_28420 [soil metagenome]
MRVSPTRLAANRRNARKSTGPRTAAGKHRSSRNAVSHGIFCNDLVLDGESQELFDQLRNNLLMELSPQTLVELMICDRIVTAQWKLRRLNTVEMMTHETNAQRTVIDSIHDSDTLQKIDGDGDGDGDDDSEAGEMEEKLTRISRIARTPWPKNIDDMCELMEEFKEYISPGQAISKSFLNDDGLMERLSRYEQRLELSIHRNLKQLEKVKKQTQANAQTRKMYCPFVDQKFYQDLHEQIEEHKAELECENEPIEVEEAGKEITHEKTKDAKKVKANVSERDSADPGELAEQNEAEFNQKTTESTGCHKRSVRYNPPPRSDV